MKIALANLYYLPVQGGIEKYMYELAKRFQREHEVEIIAGGGRLGERLRYSDGLREYRIPFVEPRMTTAWLTIAGMFVPACAYRISNSDFDMVHANCVPSAYAAMKASKKKPFVFTQHNNEEIIRTYAHFVGVKLYETIMSKIIENAASIISVSKSVAKEMESRYGVKSKTIYNGVDLDFFTPENDGKEFRDRYSLGDSRIVLFVGKIDKRKGLEYLAHAFEKVKRNVKNTKLVIVGKTRFEEDSYLNKIMEMMEAFGILDSVYFTGEISIEMLQEAYRACDVFVMPSITETFGIVVIEAMASGKPVVVTRSGGPEELVVDGKNGFVVGPRDSEALADRIITILTDESLAERMGRYGRIHAERNFNWDKTAVETMKVYEDALSE